MARREVWLALRDPEDPTDEGDGTQSNPYNAGYYPDEVDLSLKYKFDARVRALFDEGDPDGEAVYIHLAPGEYFTQGGVVSNFPPIGWQMGEGWTLEGGGIGATTLRLNEFTLPEAGGKRCVVGYSGGVFRNQVVRDLTIDANWPDLINKPTNGETAVLGVCIVSGGNATVENVRAINTYGDKRSENECFAIFLAHPVDLDLDEPLIAGETPQTRAMLAIRNCIAEQGHGDYVVGMTAFSRQMVDMRENVCRDLPNGFPPDLYPAPFNVGSNPSAAYQFTGRGITFTGNKSYNCPAPLYFDTGNIYDVLIAHNQFFGCGWAGLITVPGNRFFGINVRQGGASLDGKYVDLPVMPAGGSADYRVRVWLKMQGSMATPPLVPNPGHRIEVEYGGGDPLTAIETKIKDTLNDDPTPPAIGQLFSQCSLESGSVFGRLSSNAAWAGNGGTSVSDPAFLRAQRGYEFQKWVIADNLFEIAVGFWTAQQYGIYLQGTGGPECKDYTLADNQVRFTLPTGAFTNQLCSFKTFDVGGHFSAIGNRATYDPTLVNGASISQLPGASRYFFGNRSNEGPVPGVAIPGLEDTHLHVNRPGLGGTTDSGALLANAAPALPGVQQVSPAMQWSGQGWKTGGSAASQTVSFRGYIIPIQGAANPAGSWVLESSINGGAYGNPLIYSSGGGLTVPGSITAGGTGSFASLTGITAVGAVNLSPAGANVTISPTGTGGLTINPNTAGTINRVNIGGTTAGTGAFTTLTASGNVTLSPGGGTVAISPTYGSVTISPNGGSVTISPSMGAVTIATSGGYPITVTLGAAGSSQTILSPGNNIVEQRNTTFAQAYRIHDTYADASNYRRASLYWSGGAFTIETQASGSGMSGLNDLNLKTGAGKQLRFFGGSSGAQIWSFDSGGHLVAGSGSEMIKWGTMPGSSFPALKRSGVELHVRRADDSAGTPLVYPLAVSAKTTSYTITATEGNRCFTNAGATAGVTFTLPDASSANVGFHCYFLLEAAQSLTVQANGSNFIRIGTALSGSHGSATTSTIGNTLHLVCTQSGMWVALGHHGDWTVT
jgi:hypothetical protein